MRSPQYQSHWLCEKEPSMSRATETKNQWKASRISALFIWKYLCMRSHIFSASVVFLPLDTHIVFAVPFAQKLWLQAKQASPIFQCRHSTLSASSVHSIKFNKRCVSIEPNTFHHAVHIHFRTHTPTVVCYSFVLALSLFFFIFFPFDLFFFSCMSHSP